MEPLPQVQLRKQLQALEAKAIETQAAKQRELIAANKAAAIELLRAMQKSLERNTVIRVEKS